MQLHAKSSAGVFLFQHLAWSVLENGTISSEVEFGGDREASWLVNENSELSSKQYRIPIQNWAVRPAASVNALAHRQNSTEFQYRTEQCYRRTGEPAGEQASVRVLRSGSFWAPFPLWPSEQSGAPTGTREVLVQTTVISICLIQGLFADGGSAR